MTTARVTLRQWCLLPCDSGAFCKQRSNGLQVAMRWLRKVDLFSGTVTYCSGTVTRILVQPHKRLMSSYPLSC